VLCLCLAAQKDSQRVAGGTGVWGGWELERSWRGVEGELRRACG
jgi:hypothetical protein